MAKILINIYPGLRSKMSYKGDDTETLSEALKISKDSTRRRLRGESEFDLNEIKILMDRYECSFEDLFEKEEKSIAI